MTEPDLTPIDCERKLRALVNTLSSAQADLRTARDEEVKAKHAYETARLTAMFSDGCPKVTRGGTTTAERDAWVEREAHPEQRDYDFAEAKRKSAEDYLRTVRDQGVLVATLAKSVQQAYAMAGRGDAA